MYGLEMDVGAGYRNTAEGFYAGFTWGVLWPLGALNRGIPLAEGRRGRLASPRSSASTWA